MHKLLVLKPCILNVRSPSQTLPLWSASITRQVSFLMGVDDIIKKGQNFQTALA